MSAPATPPPDAYGPRYPHLTLATVPSDNRTSLLAYTRRLLADDGADPETIDRATAAITDAADDEVRAAVAKWITLT